MVLNNVAKFHKSLIKSIQLREWTSFQMVIFHKQRAVTPEGIVRFGPLSKLTSWYLTIIKIDIMVLNNVTKFHKILIKTIRLRERTSLGQTYGRT